MKITHTITTSTGDAIPAIDNSVWRQSIERIEANRRSHRIGYHDSEECMMCGRKMSRKAHENARHVHMTIDGDLVPMAAEVGSLSQGWFPVGSECAKRLPKGFAEKPWVG